MAFRRDSGYRGREVTNRRWWSVCFAVQVEEGNKQVQGICADEGDGKGAGYCDSDRPRAFVTNSKRRAGHRHGHGANGR